jgi:hypothetical protein
VTSWAPAVGREIALLVVDLRDEVPHRVGDRRMAKGLRRASLMIVRAPLRCERVPVR